MGAQLLLHGLDVGVVFVHDPQQPAEEGRQPVRQPVDGTEVHHAEPAVVEQPEVARVRIPVQQPSPRRPGEQEPHEQDARPVALLLAAVADDLRQRRAVHPLGDQDMLRAHHHTGHVDVGITRVRIGEGLLRGGLEKVVELFGDPVAQLVEQRLDVEPGHQQPEHPPGPAQLVEVTDQRPSGAWVLDLHRDPAAVAPDRLVDLPDGCRGGGRVVELGEVVPPGLAQVFGQHLMHAASGQRRRGLLQLGQRGAVRPGDLGRQRRLEDRQRLAELHGAALELAEHPEDLVGGALLYFLGDDLG